MPERFDKKPYPFGPGIRRPILGAKIKIIPKSLPILRITGEINRLSFQGGIILPNISTGIIIMDC